MMRVIGVADSEFTNPDGNGRVNLYTRNSTPRGPIRRVAPFPGALPAARSDASSTNTTWWWSRAHGESNSLALGYQQPPRRKQIVKTLSTAAGASSGRIFVQLLPAWPARPIRRIPADPVAAWEWDRNTGVTALHRGEELREGAGVGDWLVNVGASPTRGHDRLNGVEGTVMSLTPAYTSQRWISSTDSIPYFSVPMPVEKLATPAEQCGRFVHTGLHVSMGGNGIRFLRGVATAARPDASGEGFGVPDLRALGLRDPRQPSMPTPPPVPPPGAVNMPPRPGDPAARAAAAAATAAAADGRLKPGDRLR